MGVLGFLRALAGAAKEDDRKSIFMQLEFERRAADDQQRRKLHKKTMYQHRPRRMPAAQPIQLQRLNTNDIFGLDAIAPQPATKKRRHK